MQCLCIVLAEICQKDSPRRDLNSRPLVYKTSALTTELRRRGVWRRNTDGHQFLNVKIRYPFVIGREGDFAPVAQSVSASYL